MEKIEIDETLTSETAKYKGYEWISDIDLTQMSWIAPLIADGTHKLGLAMEKDRETAGLYRQIQKL